MPWAAACLLLVLTTVGSPAAVVVPDASAAPSAHGIPPASGMPVAADGQDARPNIVLITADDMRADDLRFMPRTRRLLGGAGTTFTDALSNYPLCCPARATLLTGQYAHNHGVRGNEWPYGGHRTF
ncbi:MAG: sulfatase-like hydrolase/transferase, partial [Nocardioidaceae bacterium]